ncbi:MAG: DNA damage-inducible protein D [Lachnospiraceae bacterium]|jgi:DNA-damage-inducible protein D|nr:DNA damage-inducible protein D [Lachnospiraceae bacterium]
MNKIEKVNKEYNEEKTFEEIKHIDEQGNEYWEARELQVALEYTEWRNFEKVIKKAVISAENSKNTDEVWLVEVNKPIITGRGKEEYVKDYKLSRYICYLIVQNGDPRKKPIALGQKYFAIQTRKQELSEREYEELPETEKRFYQRKLTKQGNYSLQQVAKAAGVKNMDQFHNAGYKGLYNGETADDIFKRKGLRYREDILDNMSSDELAVNHFRIVQAKQKLQNENIKGELKAKEAHLEVGQKVRKAIVDMGGTMPEKLPTPKKSLKELEKEKTRLELESKGGVSNG